MHVRFVFCNANQSNIKKKFAVYNGNDYNIHGIRYYTPMETYKIFEITS